MNSNDNTLEQLRDAIARTQADYRQALYTLEQARTSVAILSEVLATMRSQEIDLLRTEVALAKVRA